MQNQMRFLTYDSRKKFSILISTKLYFVKLKKCRDEFVTFSFMQKKVQSSQSYIFKCEDFKPPSYI